MDISDGLSHNNVYALHQDQYGYIWIGTGAGLHKYDGEVLKNYYTDYSNLKNSLGKGYIRDIFEDSNGTLWVGSEGGGITKIKNGIITNFTTFDELNLNNDHVEKILELPDGSLLIGTWGGGINVLKDGKIEHITAENSGLINNNIVDLLYDNDTGILWIGCWDGGVCQSKDGEIICEKYNKDGFNSSRARTLAKTDDGSIWIGTWGDGLYEYKDGTYFKRNIRGKNRNAVGESKILSMTSIENRLWIGTFGGGIILYEDGQFNDFTYNQNNENSLSSNFVESTLIDIDGNLWVGTFGGGVSKLEKSYFNSYKNIPNAQNSLSNNFIRSIIHYDKENMLVATRGHGIDLFDGNKFHAFRDVYGYESDFTTIFSLLKTKSDDYWFGGTTEIGLFVLRGDQLEDHTLKYGVNFKEYNINTIIESFDGSIWIGAEFDGGLNQIQGDSLIRYRHDPNEENTVGNDNVMCIYQTPDSTIWIGLRRYGLNSYKDGKFKRYRYNKDDTASLSNDFVYCIFEDSHEDLWIGTEKGLNKFNKSKENFTRYFTEDGLSSDMIASILEDKEGNLWLGTHKAISKFNPNTNVFWNFSDYAGVNNYPFNFNVATINSYTGEMYFGGVNGMVKFDPRNVSTDLKSPRVLITGMSINNETVLPGETVAIRESIEKTQHIYLDREDKFIQFEFSGMNMLSGSFTLYKYRLLGFEDEWQYSGSRKFVSYSNLPPGEYSFQVMSSYDGHVWSKPAIISMTVSRAWWQSYWFYALVLLASGLLLFLFIGWRNRYLEIQKRKLTKLVNQKTDEIQARNNELKDALKTLQKTQEKLIQSEKITALSQVVFNLLHELNSPLGSTKAGLEFVKRDFLLEMKELPKIIKELSEKEFTLFGNFVEELLTQSKYYDTKETRELSRKIQNELKDLGIENERILESLVAINCFSLSWNTKEFLKLEKSVELIELAETIVLKYLNLCNMDNSVERSINILNSLKTYTLQDTERDFKIISLVSSIEKAISLREHEFKRGIHVVRKFESDPNILANEELLKQVWLNIISNANYAMSYQGNMSITVTERPGKAIVTFEDDGPGIPPDLQEKIFEPFFTTKPLGEGRGIGLDIVQKIVKRHEGLINMVSKPGETMFLIELPIYIDVKA